MVSGRKCPSLGSKLKFPSTMAVVRAKVVFRSNKRYENPKVAERADSEGVSFGTIGIEKFYKSTASAEGASGENSGVLG